MGGGGVFQNTKQLSIILSCFKLCRGYQLVNSSTTVELDLYPKYLCFVFSLCMCIIQKNVINGWDKYSTMVILASTIVIIPVWSIY